jgi:hypothetical protein
VGPIGRKRYKPKFQINVVLEVLRSEKADVRESGRGKEEVELGLLKPFSRGWRFCDRIDLVDVHREEANREMVNGGWLRRRLSKSERSIHRAMG